MNCFGVFGLALALAMDALAVSITAGLVVRDLTGRHVFRVAFHFGLFQFLMPILGWAAGVTVEGYISGYDHWIAFALLTWIGVKTLHDAMAAEAGAATADPTRGWLLVTLAFATSLDALAVGLSMALLRVSIWTPSLVIGLVAGILSTIGICFGAQLGSRFGKLAHVCGGVVLLGIGMSILLAH